MRTHKYPDTCVHASHAVCRLSGGDAGPWLRGLRAFVEDFFRCEDCRAHFLQVLDSPEGAQQIASRQDAMLWMWRTHNAVNDRLAKVRCAGCRCCHRMVLQCSRGPSSALNEQGISATRANADLHADNC